MNYLNSKERNAVASLLLTVGVAEDILRSKNTTKEEAKKLKKIQEWNEKYMRTIYQELGNQVNRELTIKFINSGYDMAVLQESEE